MRNRTPIPDSISPGLAPSITAATAQATAQFARRLQKQFAADYFRRTTFGPTVSSLGLGTYLGEPTDAVDAEYATTIQQAIAGGINVIDTAINYRCQRSERAVGAAMQQLLSSRAVERDAVVLCSKGGYIPLDGTPPASRQAYDAYVRREFVEADILTPAEVVASGHSLAPRFLRYCIAKSRQNLGVRTIDVYYLHNPEQQLASVGPDELRRRLRAAFGALEEAVARREIGVYGCATWNGLRVPPDARDHLALHDLVAIAREVAGDGHHFRVIQLPINLAMPEALRAATQLVAGKLRTPLEAATELGLTVVASASLMQGRLTAALPETVRELVPNATSDAQRAVSFVRTIPGVTCTLVGMKRSDHLTENLRSARAL